MDTEKDIEDTIRIRNAEGKIRQQVLSVLELAVPEIRDYLVRPNPNIEDALWRLDQIEELMIKLRRENS